MFAGRNASCTHAAMSSTRVMGTCAVMGQAVGTAVSIAIEKNLYPRDVLNHINLLQKLLLDDDCYLPGITNRYSEDVMKAKISSSSGNPEPVRDGITRPVGSNLHRWDCSEGDWIQYEFDAPVVLNKLFIVFDSGLDQNIALSRLRNDDQLNKTPSCLVKDFSIYLKNLGKWYLFKEISDNYLRSLNFQIKQKAEGVRLVINKTHGNKKTAVYAFYFT